jgi:2-keto-4-pentenoate hydratase/2-oxohepta-3-ene-1,7-dioic acid hydratase in catechol pathway
VKLGRLGPRGAEMPAVAADGATYDLHAGDVVELEVEGLGRGRDEMVAA